MPQNHYTIWGKARAALLSHFQKPNTAAIWEETHSAAILNISCTDPLEYTRQAMEAVQRLVCPFCAAPHNILGNAWAHLTPSWSHHAQ